jgi:arylsulfatase B
MSEKWRLNNGTELYDIDADPGQKNDVAKTYPDQVKAMRAFYDAWWAELEPTFALTTEIYLGHKDHPVVSMTSHDWIQEANPPWNQGHIRKGSATKDGKHPGHWAVKVVTGGKYSFSLRRWPAEANKPINAGLPKLPNVPGATKPFSATPGKAFAFKTATLRVDGKDLSSALIKEGDTHVVFTANLAKGSHKLAPVFKTADGKEVGAYYLIVQPAK